MASKLFTEEERLLKETDADIATPITKIDSDAYIRDSVVKVACTFVTGEYAKAHYFSRAIIPYGGPYYQHVGVYVYKMKTLEKTHFSCRSAFFCSTFERRLCMGILISLSLKRLLIHIPPKLRSRNAGHFPVRSQNFQKNGLHLLHPISITPLSSELEWGYAYCMQIDKSIFF